MKDAGPGRIGEQSAGVKSHIEIALSRAVRLNSAFHRGHSRTGGNMPCVVSDRYDADRILVQIRGIIA